MYYKVAPTLYKNTEETEEQKQKDEIHRIFTAEVNPNTGLTKGSEETDPVKDEIRRIFSKKEEKQPSRRLPCGPMA